LIKFIIKQWIKDYEQTNNRIVRESYVVLSGVIGIICNLFLFASKLTIGLLINSIAVISDAVNNLTDLASSFVSILGAKLSNRPPDENHPYGHGRSEYIAALIVAFIIFAVGFELLISSYHKIINPEKLDFSALTLGLLTLAALVKLWMYSYNMYIAKTINSSINRATAHDSLNDFIATSLIIVSMIVGTFVDLPIDGIAGMGISLLILYSGFNVAKDTGSLLLGSAPDPKLAERISQIVGSGKHVIGTHELVIHDYGPSQVFASIHAEVPDYLNIVEGHSSIDLVENQIVEELGIEIVVHMDPISTDAAKIEQVRQEVTAALDQETGKTQIHNFRIAQADARIIVIFDVEILADSPDSEYAEVKKRIREAIEGKHPNYAVVINFIGRRNQLNHLGRSVIK